MHGRGDALCAGDPIVRGLSPAEQEIATTTGIASGVAGRLRRGGAVVDDEDLAQVAGTECDLVQVRVVVDAVLMEPVRLPARTTTSSGGDHIDVHPLRVLSDGQVVRFGRVGVLDEPVGHLPLPHDLTSGAVLLHLNDASGEFGRVTGVAQGLQFGQGLPHPGDEQHVTVRHQAHVMVRHVVGGGVNELPHHLSLWVQFLNLAPNSCTVDDVVRLHRATHDVPIVTQGHGIVGR